MGLALMLVPNRALAVGETDWLGRINEIRQGSQLPPVREEAAWSAGILAHLNYLRQTPPSYITGEYVSEHTENPASPYYTASGAKEAESSDLGGGTSNVEAIDNWLTAPFHAIGMLRPALQAVAFARDPSTGNAGLDVISGLAEYGYPSQQVLFPGPGSTIDLPRFLGESPSPLETCQAQHPGADYNSAGLPLIALLTESPSAGLSATLTRPDGSSVNSSSDELCVVTASNFVTNDAVYGPTGESILATDYAVFVIPRLPLVAGSYTADIAQPGRADIVWSFNSQPKPEPVELSPNLRLRLRGSAVRVRAARALLGRRVTVAIRREWVPCALVLRSRRCTWVTKGRPRRKTLRLSPTTAIRFRRPAKWEKVVVSARTYPLTLGVQSYPTATATIVLKGPKPDHVAR